jgi:hypothetical protein
MTNYSNSLRLALQETGENDGTWGDVANNGVFELTEDAIAGRIGVIANSSPRVLTTANGANDEARYMTLGVTGSPGVDLDLDIQAVPKIYLVDNQLSGGFAINIGVSGNLRANIANGLTVFVWCDATDTFVVEVGNAATATLAATATNSTQLGGVVAASYARLDVQQGFTRAQHTGRGVLSESATNVAVNAALSNAFRLDMGGNWNLLNPTNPQDGQVIRFLIIQDASPRTLTFGSQYKFPGGVTPVLSTGAGEVDLAGFEFDSLTGFWYGNMIKNLS